MNSRDFVEGRKFRVIAEGASLSGLVSIGNSAWTGWSMPLPVGEVIECEGMKMGWGSDNIPQAMFSHASTKAAHASFVQFVPEAGFWQAWPADGYLEPVEE